MAPLTKRDLYADVTFRTLAELEAGAAPWVSHGRQRLAAQVYLSLTKLS
jgi:antirestriction protein ArdC